MSLEIQAEVLRLSVREKINAKTKQILDSGIVFNNINFPCDNESWNTAKEACEQISAGMLNQALVKGTGNSYMMLDATNVQQFFIAGRDFKVNTLVDGYKLKDLGGTLSNGTEVTALKDLDYYALVYWIDPRV